tara:strand:+ start:237 stop:392 length:156 start_codon:yes stop_codon:yes gene_type:complete
MGSAARAKAVMMATKSPMMPVITVSPAAVAMGRSSGMKSVTTAIHGMMMPA